MLLWSSRCSIGLIHSCCRTGIRLRSARNPRRSPHRHRFLFTSLGGKLAQANGEVEANHPPLKEWSLEVSPFGSLRARLSCSISVGSLDPHAFPEANRAFVLVRGEERLKDLEGFDVQYDERGKELLISAEKADGGLSVHVSVPIKTNIFINTHAEGHVEVKNLECDICKVYTDKGNCLLRSVKGHELEVRSGGDVTGEGTLHGNVDISAFGKGEVRVKKLQGTEMKVSTEDGDLAVKAIYAHSSHVSSCTGRVELGLVHGDATVKNTTGNTFIDGSNGLLKVSSQSGDVDVYVGDGASSELSSVQGTMRVRVPPSLRANVDLRGTKVEISPDVKLFQVEENTAEKQVTLIGYINSDGPSNQQIKVATESGSVHLKTQSWFQSLKLGR
ncbi:protein FAM185A [Stigmatopora nigra]